jgi:hypothetical protein
MSLNSFVCVLFALFFEIIVYVVEKYISLPPTELVTANNDLVATKLELCTVKSVQLELVKHSKLTRKMIKLEKQIETIKESQLPKVNRWNYILRVSRVRIACTML